MVFYLASLPNGIFKTVEKMFLLYSKGQLKGQKIPRSKKSVAAKPPDLKGSKLKCLRGVDLEVGHKLLKDVVDMKSSLVELSGECSAVKQLNKIQTCFLKVTNLSSWKEANERYPEDTKTEKLETFCKLNFSSPTIPEPFMRFCQQAMKAKRLSSISKSHTDSKVDDDLFITELNHCLALFLKENVLDLGEKLEDVWKKVKKMCWIH